VSWKACQSGYPHAALIKAEEDVMLADFDLLGGVEIHPHN